MNQLFENYQEINKAVQDLSDNRTFLLPVSKTFPAEDIRALYDCGIRDFAESRLQELAPKAEALPKDIKWHFIGHLQSNKVRKVVPLASVIHSVDSAALLEKIDRAAADFQHHVDCFIEFNTGDENSKTGADPSEADNIFTQAQKCSEFCRVCGVMGMAPLGGSEEENRAAFRRLVKLKNYGEQNFGLDLADISMGMSGDYKEAIAEGSTIVRIGTAIFGRREYPTEK